MELVAAQCRILFDVIERSLQNTSQTNLIRNLYRGTMANKIICLNCQSRSDIFDSRKTLLKQLFLGVSEREEEFFDIQVIVKGFKSLEQSLQSFVTFEILTGENKYQCDNCQTKSDAQKGVIFRELPEILIFSLTRFEYDWENVMRQTFYFSSPIDSSTSFLECS